jgi:hypothetical protein
MRVVVFLIGMSRMLFGWRLIFHVGFDWASSMAFGLLGVATDAILLDYLVLFRAQLNSKVIVLRDVRVEAL